MELNVLLYQELIDHQHNRHEANSYAWPNPPMDTPAVSRYPNILAELDASGWWIDRIAEYAGVSQAIMASVMESSGELSFSEFRGLARCFGCKMDYLTAPVLSIVDPSTSKGKIRIQHLKELELKTEGMDGTSRFLYDRNCKYVLPALESGKSVTYAAYRWACIHLQQELERKAAFEAKQRRTRTGELKHTQTSGNAQMPLSIQTRKARERDRAKKMEMRLSEIREYAHSVKMGDEEKTITTLDLLSLMEFSKADPAGSILLAMLYGRAMGYRTAKAEVM